MGWTGIFDWTSVEDTVSDDDFSLYGESDVEDTVSDDEFWG